MRGSYTSFTLSQNGSFSIPYFYAGAIFQCLLLFFLLIFCRGGSDSRVASWAASFRGARRRP